MTENNFANEYIVDFNISNIVAMKQCWASGSRFSYLKTPRPDFGVLYVLCEKIIYRMNDSSMVTAKKNDIVFLPMGLHYEAEHINRRDCLDANYLINFLLCGIQGQCFLTSDKIVIITPEDYQKYKSEFSGITMLYKNTIASQIELKARLLMLLYSLVKETLLVSGHFSVEQSIAYINENCNHIIDIESLAQRCCISGAAYRKRFKERTGMSPVKYINYIKINKACSMLESSGIVISELSELLGFYDLSYFYKIFKAYKGVTPLEYKMKFLSKNDQNHK